MQKNCSGSSQLPTVCETVNQEHILPMDLGAPQSFCMPADAIENTRANKLIRFCDFPNPKSKPLQRQRPRANKKWHPPRTAIRPLPNFLQGVPDG
jgi:hypothetical protein